MSLVRCSQVTNDYCPSMAASVPIHVEHVQLAELDQLLYSLEKLGVAVELLATGRNKIRDRVWEAALYLHASGTLYLPDSLDEQWAALRSKFVFRKELADHEKRFLGTARTDYLVEIARSITVIESQLRELLARHTNTAPGYN